MSPDQNPHKMLYVMRMLVAEMKQAGVEFLSVKDLETAVQTIEGKMR